MKLPFPRALILTALLLSAGQAFAQNALNFLSPQDLKISTFTPPPAEGTEAAEQDLQYVLELQRNRTKDQCARAMTEVSLGLNSIFGPAYGPLTKNEIALSSKIYSQIFRDTDYFVNSVKSRFKRPRPFQRSTEVRPCIPPHNSSSYPSGHAAISRIAALVLGQVFPEKSEALLVRADEVALDRVIGGVHHLIDIQAGQRLSDALYLQMTTKPAFQKVIQNLKADLAKGNKK